MFLLSFPRKPQLDIFIQTLFGYSNRIYCYYLNSIIYHDNINTNFITTAIADCLGQTLLSGSNPRSCNSKPVPHTWPCAPNFSAVTYRLPTPSLVLNLPVMWPSSPARYYCNPLRDQWNRIVLCFHLFTLNSIYDEN